MTQYVVLEGSPESRNAYVMDGLEAAAELALRLGEDAGLNLNALSSALIERGRYSERRYTIEVLEAQQPRYVQGSVRHRRPR